jgi:hypothetical protein
LLSGLFFVTKQKEPVKIFDVHLHGAKDPASQLTALRDAGVYKAAISTSWNLQNSYRSNASPQLLFGLMFPCPNGKVPYSLQPCYNDNSDWPSVEWVEQQIKDKKIDFFGEVLTQYYGISSSDSLMLPYYQLAKKYDLPVGIHTGGAGPHHGSPNFKMEMGNPILLKSMLAKFPKLRIWIMHAGDQYYKETIEIMQAHTGLYSDISVISNPDIVSQDRFGMIMKEFIAAGLEDRLMFGTDNGDIQKVIGSIESLGFLTTKQKEKLYSLNAELFFGKKK